MRKNYILSFLFLSFVGLISAQNLLGIYEFTGAGACPNQNPNVTAQPTNATFSSFNAQNVTCSSAQNVFNNSGWNTTVDLDTAEYIGFSITAADCYRVNLDSLVFSFRNSGTGTPMWFLRSSVDGFQTNIAAGTSSNPGTTLLTNPVSLGTSIFDANQSVEFRFYLTGMPATLNTFRVDDIKLYGAIDYFGPIDLYVDADGDGFGTGNVVQTFCSNPGGYATNNTDCDDTDPLLNPSTIWYEDLDNDGYGNNLQTQIGCTHTFSNASLLGEDCNENNAAINPTTVWYEDADNDGYGNINMTETNCYSQAFANAVLNSDDCMDDQVTVYPGAPEICDEFDNNCDGDINEDLTFVIYYIDNDGDLYGAGSAGDFCNDPGIGYTLDNTDCNDDDFSLYLTDTLFIDADMDGYDAGTAELCIGTTIPAGYIDTSLGSDCVDTNNLINPAAVDVLGDTIDQNCDGIIDGYVGLNEISNSTFSIAPNPGNDFITIHSTLSGVVEIRNVEGKVIRQVSFDKNTSINMCDVSEGIYFISMNQKTIKWLKQ